LKNADSRSDPPAGPGSCVGRLQAKPPLVHKVDVVGRLVRIVEPFAEFF
jgi:hypothetical protein